MNDLDEMARRERLEYFRKWRAANKDKVKQHNQDYWKRKAEARLQDRNHGGTSNVITANAHS